MLQGRVRKALKYVNDEENLAGGVHKLSDEVVEELKKKHPSACPEEPSVMLDITSENPDSVLFEGLDGI